MKKWIGTVINKDKIDNFDLPNGMYVEITEIPESELYEKYYDIKLYYLYNDGSKQYQNDSSGHAKTLASAKRIINKDTPYKASDWTWKEVEE